MSIWHFFWFYRARFPPNGSKCTRDHRFSVPFRSIGAVLLRYPLATLWATHLRALVHQHHQVLFKWSWLSSWPTDFDCWSPTSSSTRRLCVRVRHIDVKSASSGCLSPRSAIVLRASDEWHSWTAAAPKSQWYGPPLITREICGTGKFKWMSAVEWRG